MTPFLKYSSRRTRPAIVRRHPFLCLCLILFAATFFNFPAPAREKSDAPEKTSAARKNTASAAKSENAGSADTTQDHWPRSHRAEPEWKVIDASASTCEAYLHNSLQTAAKAGLSQSSFTPINPTQYAAALGIATVYQPDSAGLFVSTGRRFFVQCTGSKAGALYSYESLARIGCALTIPRDAASACRILWDAGKNDPLSLETFLEKAVKESPNTGAWLVVGQVDFAGVTGRKLSASPLRSTPGYSGKSRESDTRALLAAVVVKNPGKSGGAAKAFEDITAFFPAEDVLPSKTDAPLCFRAHCAALSKPFPPADPAKPVQAIWEMKGNNYEKLPKASAVFQALSPSSLQRAYVAVYAISGAVPYSYKDPGLMDPTKADPAILTDQRLATKNNPLGEVVYKKPRILLRKEAAEAIVRISKRAQERGVRLKIYDAYRPLSVTQRLYHSQPSDSPYLAKPNVGSRHNRGAAVDISLTDPNGKELEMPSEYLDFSRRAHRDAPGMTDKARRNMELLTALMATEGFTTLNVEWWHYDAPNWEKYPVLDVPLWPDNESSSDHSEWIEGAFKPFQIADASNDNPMLLNQPDAADKAAPADAMSAAPFIIDWKAPVIQYEGSKSASSFDSAPLPLNIPISPLQPVARPEDAKPAAAATATPTAAPSPSPGNRETVPAGNFEFLQIPHKLHNDDVYESTQKFNADDIAPPPRWVLRLFSFVPAHIIFFCWRYYLEIIVAAIVVASAIMAVRSR